MTGSTELPSWPACGPTTAVAVEQARGCIDAAARPLRAVMVQAHSPRADVLTDHLQRFHAATGVPVVLQDYPVISG